MTFHIVEKFIEGFIESEALRIIRVDEEMEKEALELFKRKIHVKSFSYTDAVSEVAAKNLNLTLISFDSGFEIPTIGKNYWISLGR